MSYAVIRSMEEVLETLHADGCKRTAPRKKMYRAITAATNIVREVSLEAFLKRMGEQGFIGPTENPNVFELKR